MPGPAAMPKYQRIAAALRQELARGAHGPGGKLPSERSLAARYGVNRQTVRAALQQLREDGLVVTGGAAPAPHRPPPTRPPGSRHRPPPTRPPGSRHRPPPAPPLRHPHRRTPIPALRHPHRRPPSPWAGSRSSPCRRPSPRCSGCAAGSARSSTTTANWARRGKRAGRR
ncbi:GntR family transcriptional regulator [Streptomyces cirratus]